MWPKAISMIANGDLPLEEIITDTFPLVQFKKGIDKVDKGLKKKIQIQKNNLGIVWQRQYQSHADSMKKLEHYKFDKIYQCETTSLLYILCFCNKLLK